MKKNILIWFVMSVAVLFLLPWAAVSFVKSDAAMAVCFLLFFVINPICSVVSGALACRYIKRLWWMPAATAILFLAGAWAIFEMGETAFVIYALVYLAIGAASMLVNRKFAK